MEDLSLDLWCRLDGPFGTTHAVHYCPLLLHAHAVDWSNVRILRDKEPLDTVADLAEITGPDQAVIFPAGPRLFVSGYDRQATYEMRYDKFTSPSAPPQALPIRDGTCQHRAVPFSVQEGTGGPREGEIVTFGFPCKIGELVSADNVRVLNQARREVTCQASVTARWPDGSVRWLLVGIPVSVAANSTAEFTLEYGTEVQRAVPAEALSVQEEGDDIFLETGPARARISKTAFRTLSQVWIAGQEVVSEGERHGLLVTEPGGKTFAAHLRPPERIVIEEAGPLRAVVMAEGWHVADDGARLLKYICRIEAYAGRTDFKVRYTFVNKQPDCETCIIAASDQPDHTFEVQYRPVTSIALAMSLSQRAQSYATAVSGEEIMTGALDRPVSLSQTDREHCRIIAGESDTEQAGQLENWLAVGGLTVAVQHLWQLFPKRLSAAAEAVEVVLVPASDEQPFRAYRGMAKRHDIMLRFHSNDDAEQARQAARAFEYPLTAIVPSQWYDETGAMGRVGSRDLRRFLKYDRDCDLGRQLRQKDRRHFYADQEYGMLNYGDWFGGALGGDNPLRDKAGNSYGCQEYDLVQAFCQAFIRGGNPDDLREAAIADAHRIDVDTRHDHQDPALIGAQSTHNGPEHVTAHDYCSHSWATGLLNYYYLTGDKRSLEAALLNGEARLRNMDLDFIRAQNAERTVGWPIIEAAALYAYEWDARYLEHMAAFKDAILQNQKYGNFPFYHLKRNIDEPQGFMNYIVYEGLVFYYRATRDPRVAEAIVQAAERIREELPVSNRECIAYALDTLGCGFQISGDYGLLHKAIALYKTRRFHGGWGKGLAQGRKGAPEFLSVLEHSGPLYFWVQTEHVQLDGQLPFDVQVQVTSLSEEPLLVKLRWSDLPSHIQLEPEAYEFELTPEHPVELSFTLTGPNDAVEAGEQWAAVVIEYPDGSQRWELPVAWQAASEQIELELDKPALGFRRAPKLVKAGLHHWSGRDRWIVVEEPPSHEDFYFRVEQPGEYAFAVVMLDDALDQQSHFIQVDDQPVPGQRLAEAAANWDDYPLYAEGIMAGPQTHLDPGYHKLRIQRYASMNRPGSMIYRSILIGPVRNNLATFVYPSRLTLGAGQQTEVRVAVANFGDEEVPITIAPSPGPCDAWMQIAAEPVSIPSSAVRELRLALNVPDTAGTETYTAHLEIHTPHAALCRSLAIHTIEARDLIEIQAEHAETVRYGSHPVVCEDTESGYALIAQYPSGRWFSEPGCPTLYFPGHRWFFEIGRESEYTVWTRVLWSKSPWDGQPEFFANRYTAWLNFDDGEDVEFHGEELLGNWTWMRGPREKLGVGEHFVQWTNGWVNVLIDKIVVTANPDFQPAEAEG